MSDSLQSLPKFAQDPQTAVKEALQSFESGPLKSRLDELESDPNYCPHKICNTSWAGRTIAVCCETCQVTSPSYLCVPCFLNGNHVGHKYYITYVTTASCSCGNPHKINPSGFCSRHHIPSPNPHLDDFGEELSQIPIQIFSEAIESLTFLAAFDLDGLKAVIDFLLSIATKSDALMRCLEIAICERNDLSLILINSAAFSLNSLKLISQFFYNFFNDDYFALNFGYSIIKAIIPFTKTMINYDIKMAFGNIMPPHHHIFEFMISYDAYLRPQTTSFILQKECDIINLILASILQFQRAIDSVWNFSKVKLMFSNQFFSLFSDLIKSLPELKRKEMYQALLPVFAKWEFSHPFKRVFGNKADDQNKQQELVFDLTNIILPIFDSLNLSIVDDLENFSNFWYKLNETALNCQEETIIDQICQSTLETADISSFQTFSIIFESILLNSTDPVKTFTELIKNISIEKFIQVTITMPLRWISYASQSYFGLFVRNDDSTLLVAQKFYSKQSITKKLFPMFCLIQFYAGLYPNKNELLRIIESIYGLFSQFDDDQKESDNLFSIIYFISCLVFDRVVMTNDAEEFRKSLIIAILQEKPLTVINLNKMLWDQITTVPSYIAELENITTRVKGEEYSLLKLKPNVKWSIIQPWKPPSEIMKMIGNFIQKHEDQLAPFTDWMAEPFGLDLKSFLLTKSMFALEYKALSDFVDDPTVNKATVHMVLNIILQTHRMFSAEDFDKHASINEKCEKSEKIKANENDSKKVETNENDSEKVDINENDSEKVDINENDSKKAETNENDSKKADINENDSEKVGVNENDSEKVDANESCPEKVNDTHSTDDDSVVAESMEDLVDLVPFHFHSFLKCPISFMDRPTASFIDLMKSVGTLANPVLEELGLSPVLVQSSDKNKEEKRDRAKQLRLSIMADFRNQQNMFNGSKADLAENEECSVCRDALNDSILCYPSIIHKTGIPSFLQTGVFQQTFFANICTHLVHWSCAKNEMNDSMYRCPIDRSMYNFFIPRITTGFAVLSDDSKGGNEKGEEEEEDGLDENKNEKENKFNIFFKAMEIINENFGKLKRLVHPATIIAGHLVIAEMRYRMWPDSLDKPVFSIFMSNFFLNAWHFIRMQREAMLDVVDIDQNKNINEDSNIEKLVLSFLTENKPPFKQEEVSQNIKKLAVGLVGKDLFVYLRQAAIFQHFCLGVDLSPNTQFMDWESLLSFRSLCDKYEIPFDDSELKKEVQKEIVNGNDADADSKSENAIELPLLSLVKLPNNFLEFALPPYSLNLAETSSLTALCLLTNTVISISKTTSNSPYVSLSAHLTKLGGTTLLLLLNGPFSTSIAVASNEFSFVVKIISPYINDYGDEDPGFVTGRVLTLSHERLEKAFDLYLSGEWTKFIPR